MNLLKGKVAKGNVVTASGKALPLPKGASVRDGQEVVYGIRPEHLEIGKGIDLKVSVVEPTGPEIHLYGDLGEDEVCAVLRERIPAKRGDMVSLAPRLDKVHVFDAESGKVL